MEKHTVFTESHLLVLRSALDYDCAIYKRIAVVRNSKPRQKKIFLKHRFLKRVYV